MLVQTLVVSLSLSLSMMALVLSPESSWASDEVSPCFTYRSEPLYFCTYTNTPRSSEGINFGQIDTLESGTVCLSKSDLGSIVLKQVERIRHVYQSGSYRVREYPQTVLELPNEGKVRENDRRFVMTETAPLISLIGQRSTKFVLDKRTMEGSIRMKFYRGGRLTGSAYSDEKNPLRCEAISEFPSAAK